MTPPPTNTPPKRKTLLSSIANFLGDKHFRTFSLLFAILYFGQMYAKFGYLISIQIFKAETLAWLSASVFGLFAGTATTAVIVHNKKESDKISLELLWFDIVISLLFYLDVTLAFWKEGKYGAMLAILAFAVYTSRLLYYLAEQFREENVEENNLIADTRQTHKLMQDLVQGLNINLPILSPTVGDMIKAVRAHYQDVANATSQKEKEMQVLRSATTEVESLTRQLAILTTERNDLANMVRVYTDKERTYKELVAQLESDKEVLEDELQNKNNSRGLASDKGVYKKLINSAEQEQDSNKRADLLQRAEMKLAEIKEKYNVDVTQEK